MHAMNVMMSLANLARKKLLYPSNLPTIIGS